MLQKAIGFTVVFMFTVFILTGVSGVYAMGGLKNATQKAGQHAEQERSANIVEDHDNAEGFDFDTLEVDQVTIKKADGGQLIFTAELAEAPWHQEKGLMHRTFMAEDAGMLFIFPDVAKRSFWMKDTLIALDMIFIDDDGRINHIHSMAKPLDLSRVTSQFPARAVLEINGGTADSLGIAVGDVVVHATFRNEHIDAHCCETISKENLSPKQN